MTAVPTAAPATSTDSKLHDTVTKFLEEAESGPLYSGLSETMDVLGVTIEMSASRNWGVRFSRKMPDGTVEFRHLTGDDLNLDAAAGAFAALVSLG